MAAMDKEEREYAVEQQPSINMKDKRTACKASTQPTSPQAEGSTSSLPPPIGDQKPRRASRYSRPRGRKTFAARTAGFHMLLQHSDTPRMPRASLGPKRPILPPHQQTNDTPPQMLLSRPSLMDQPVPWASAPELKVRLRRLPEDWGTLDVYKLLSPFGKLDRIEVYESRGERFGSGYVIFRPPPTNSQWLSQGLTIKDRSENWHQIECTPDMARQDSRRGNQTAQKSSSSLPTTSMTEVNAGMMQLEHQMLILCTARTTTSVPLEATANTEFNRLEIKFGMQIPRHGQGSSDKILDGQFKLYMNFAQIRQATELHSEDGGVALLITLDMPPVLYRKADDLDSTHHQTVLAWNERQTWYRQTGIDNHPDRSDMITQLQNDGVLLDVGRWLTYRLAFSTTAQDRAAFESIGKALIDHNVPLTSMEAITFAFGRPQSLLQWAEGPAQRTGDVAGLSVLSELQNLTAPSMQLEFSVRYQLEVCLSNGVLNECNLRPEFIQRLASFDADKATKILEKIADDKKRIYEPMDIFRLQSKVSVRQRKMPKYCAMVPAAVVTPTTIYFSTPVMETSNRIIRDYSHYGDRFLRVKFVDERYKGRIMAGDDDTMSQVLTRFYRTMKNGIKIGDRHYEFLAFGNSQFREHGAYFFASTGALTAERIRQEMGNFNKIQIVAKYAARLGQCFTTTRAMSLRVTIDPIPDIEQNGFCFTDGVGKISPFLAQWIAEEYGLPNSSTDYPSVFQFRLGGCKGVLAVDPALKGQVVQIRPSQEKFPAKYHGLEICRVSQLSSANLNVQIILVLSALGVPDRAFRDKMETALADLRTAMTNERKAIEQLCRNIDFSQTTLTLADMIYDGFMTASDPFMVSCMRLWHSWMIKYLKEKARIPVEHGAFVLGCVDETSTLKGHCYNTHAQDGQDEASLPEIFLQISDPALKGQYKVITGICVLTRNPALHPGDVRVVRAVNVPSLRHLRNCVVLPQTGDRDLANMCSGGDLDGDDYLVMWDPELIPQEWNHAPMDYQAPPPVLSKGPVTVDDITSFFVTHMKNDILGRIAMAHRYWADSKDCPEGVKHEICLELARLHSMAVDYAKTGVHAVMPKHLRIRAYPHWAETKHGRSYHSGKILGQLYDMVQRKDFHAAWDLPFDRRILDAYKLDDQILRRALEVKLQYDEAMRRVMSQNGIKSEFEVWTTFVLSHDSNIGDYKFAETLAEIVSGLKQCHQKLCYENAGTTAKERDWSKMGPFIAAMYTITAREVTEASVAHNKMKLVGGQHIPAKHSSFENMPFMSFPWIFAKELGHIAKGRTPTSRVMHTQSTTTTLPRRPAPKQTNINLLDDDTVLEPLQDISTAEGIIHEGELLDIHHKDDMSSHVGTGGAAPEHTTIVSSSMNQLNAPVKSIPEEYKRTTSDLETEALARQPDTAGSTCSAPVVDATNTAVAPTVAASSSIIIAEGTPSPTVAEDDEVETEEVVILEEEQTSALDALQKLVGL